MGMKTATLPLLGCGSQRGRWDDPKAQTTLPTPQTPQLAPSPRALAVAAEKSATLAADQPLAAS